MKKRINSLKPSWLEKATNRLAATGLFIHCDNAWSAIEAFLLECFDLDWESLTVEERATQIKKIHDRIYEFAGETGLRYEMVDNLRDAVSQIARQFGISI